MASGSNDMTYQGYILLISWYFHSLIGEFLLTVLAMLELSEYISKEIILYSSNTNKYKYK